ncbi:hypothetical protein PISMIDRAFT_88862 [Pisolithus microcarpus 441]|uniref:Uncharacterized protein n=1 Tax=Pisolithus microcarpus 441 TaxID=765257 RepID=A0A0D0AC83_9AGAM|nr:hypothetical protein BKA83DRAFT_88862 [Pisolithus microcarpus]KIK29653.1 hypothetical protein PISMIDRAFT_88862 [Pisolithus microcarpus 441]
MVFGHEFLGIIINKVHKAHKVNKFHPAVHALHKQSATMITMLATPVLTHLQVSGHLQIVLCYTVNICDLTQDLWIMGRS